METETPAHREATATHALAHKLEQHLDGWTYDTSRRLDRYDKTLTYQAYLTDGTHTIMVNMRVREGKVDFKAEIPHRTAKGAFVSVDVETPSIRCSASRTPEAIAKDITRRLLPDIPEAHSKAAAELAKHDAYDAQEDATRAKLQESGHFGSGRQDTLYFNKSDVDAYGEVQIHNAGKCSIKLSSLTPEQVLEILDLVNTSKKTG